MLDGALAQPSILILASIMTALQLALVLVFIASDYKAFNYVFHIDQVDTSKRLDIEDLWEMGMHPYVDPNSTLPMRPLLHMSSGILSSRVVLSPELENAVRTSLETSVRWSVGIDTADSLVLLVLFLGMVYVALFLNTVHILRTQDLLHKPSHEHGRGDVTLLDVAFWALVAASFIAQQKVSNALCIDSMIGWTTVIYIALMFVLCQPGELAPAAQAVVAATWLLHFVCMLVMSGMHLLTGLAFVCMHLLCVAAVFVHRTEPPTTLAKFVNTRFWVVVFMLSLVFMSYASYVIYVPIPHRVLVQRGPSRG